MHEVWRRHNRTIVLVGLYLAICVGGFWLGFRNGRNLSELAYMALLQHSGAMFGVWVVPILKSEGFAEETE